MKKGRILFNRIVSLVLAVMLCVTVMPNMSLDVLAATDTLTLDQAKNMAASNSSAIDSIEAKKMTKEASLKSAVKSIAVKQKNRSTFRYSPLLNLSFPTRASGTQEYEESIKPIQIQSEIDVLGHQLSDAKLDVYKDINDYFVTIVSLQDKITFNQARIESYEQTIKKNKARLLLGEAKQSDIDVMTSKVKSINTTVANDMSTLEQTKKKLSNAIGMDVTTGYSFENPYVKSEIPRDALESLIQFTLDNNQEYYEACADETMARTCVTTMRDILKGEYGSKYNTIASFINDALDGKKVNSKGFKIAYDSFLNQVDAPWNGEIKIRILFVTIRLAKEWFKGDLDGTRYIQDDPYAMMDLSLDYIDKRITKDSTKEDIKNQVEDSYNSYMSMRKAYLNYVEQVKEAKEKLTKDAVSNRLGELSYEEYESSQDSYETLQNDMIQALADYSTSLYELDRLTCGGVSEYLSGNGLNAFPAGSGTSYIDEEVANGAFYSIQPIAAQQAFVLTVTIPDDFKVEVSDFELWINNTQVGERTSVKGQLRHLLLDTKNASNAKIRLYDGDDFICDCDIDPEVYSGPLNIITNYNVSSIKDNTVGSYKLSASSFGNFTSLEVSINEGEKVASYRLKLSDKYINGDSKIPVDKKFFYLGQLSDSLDDIVIEYFDSSDNLLYTGYFDSTNLKLKKDLE